MSTGGLFAGLILLAISALWIAVPILRQRRIGRAVTDPVHMRQEELLASYERVLITIRDLDGDYETGKLMDADYQSARARWSQQGVALLEQIDALDSKNGTKRRKKAKAIPQPAAKTVQEETPDYDQAIEDAVAEYLKAQTS